MSNELSPRELAAEAFAALRTAPEEPGQRFQRLIELGWINARGQVTKLLGGDAEPESTASKNGNLSTPHEAALDRHAT